MRKPKKWYVTTLSGFAAVLAATITCAVLLHLTSTWDLVFETPWLLGIPPFLWFATIYCCIALIYFICIVTDALLTALKLRKRPRRCQKT